MHIVFIVDWDIPLEPKWRHAYFYKKLKALRKKYGLQGHMSTQSVLIIDNDQLAWDVHRLALKFGKSNIYKAEQLNDNIKLITSNTRESLSPEEQAIFTAKPCEEPDKAKIDWCPG